MCLRSARVNKFKDVYLEKEYISLTSVTLCFGRRSALNMHKNTVNLDSFALHSLIRDITNPAVTAGLRDCHD